MSSKKIVFATNFTKNTEKAKKYIKMLTKNTKAKLLLLHVYEPQHQACYPYYPAHNFSMWLHRNMSKRPQRVMDKLESLEEKYSTAGVECEKHLIMGHNPSKTILNFADKKDADMVIVGDDHKSWWEKTLFGSVIDSITRRAECPVFVVK